MISAIFQQHQTPLLIGSQKEQLLQLKIKDNVEVVGHSLQ